MVHRSQRPAVSVGPTEQFRQEQHTKQSIGHSLCGYSCHEIGGPHRVTEVSSATSDVGLYPIEVCGTGTCARGSADEVCTLQLGSGVQIKVLYRSRWGREGTHSYPGDLRRGWVRSGAGQVTMDKQWGREQPVLTARAAKALPQSICCLSASQKVHTFT